MVVAVRIIDITITHVDVKGFYHTGLKALSNEQITGFYQKRYFNPFYTSTIFSLSNS
jgi:hypothetical protein